MDSESIHAVMRAARVEAGLTQVELAALMDTQQGVVSSRETGAQQGIPHEQLERLVSATGCSLTVTPDGWAIAEPETVRLPYYGPVPCGVPIRIDEPPVQEIDLRALTDGVWKPDRHYLLRAEGESMMPQIRHEDWLVVDSRMGPRLQHIVVATVNEETTVKRLVPHPETGDPMLAPTHEGYPVRELTEFDELHIQGVVVGKLGRFVALV